MNISEMSEQEKSVVLARLCGWQRKSDGVTHSWYSSGDVLDPDGFSYDEWQRVGTTGFAVIPLNLYDPANMALAWRVLNWAFSPDRLTHQGFYASSESIALYPADEYFSIFSAPPATAQAAWLDKILELAIEAEMVTE